MNYTIKQITAKETYPVRHSVLRKGKTIETCIFIGDELKTTIHYGLYDIEKLIAVSSFFENKNHLLSEPHQFQLRGMAVIKGFQGKGLGRLLLNYAEDKFKTTQTTILWCNARETAINFYKKCDYQIIGSSFNIKSIGIHYMMYKNL